MWLIKSKWKRCRLRKHPQIRSRQRGIEFSQGGRRRAVDYRACRAEPAAVSGAQKIAVGGVEADGGALVGARLAHRCEYF